MTRLSLSVSDLFIYVTQRGHRNSSVSARVVLTMVELVASTKHGLLLEKEACFFDHGLVAFFHGPVGSTEGFVVLILVLNLLVTIVANQPRPEFLLIHFDKPVDKPTVLPCNRGITQQVTWSPAHQVVVAQNALFLVRVDDLFIHTCSYL